MLVCFFLKGLDFTSVKCQYSCTCSRQINVSGPSCLWIHLWVSELCLNIQWRSSHQLITSYLVFQSLPRHSQLYHWLKLAYFLAIYLIFFARQTLLRIIVISLFFRKSSSNGCNFKCWGFIGLSDHSAVHDWQCAIRLQCPCLFQFWNLPW